ncbi:thiamine phosphate synthase [Paenibacillus aurantius]|uniref:Thiamine-phosphate synthase n=1 Tax=Paenibacillus aurantius TaxID=2918900 RepID=A0AA96LAV2_9BACL|nr:thiamine phosphate synthase [Paenibacillus aurantius]WNQ09828.1 thiamine phosphate synthase [Paenibacillus aurantius]
MRNRRHVLHLITTGRQELEEVEALLAKVPEGSLDALHIREKHRGAKEIVHWYERLHSLLPWAPIYINDRLDAAAAVGSPGVQLGYTSLGPAAARKLMGERTRIGVSVHSALEAVKAAEEGADYVLFGHVYLTGSKEGLAPRGTEALAEVTNASPLPVIAIGGITPDNVREVLAAGCAGVAVLSGFFGQKDPVGQLLRYQEELGRRASTPRRLSQ